MPDITQFEIIAPDGTTTILAPDELTITTIEIHDVGPAGQATVIVDGEEPTGAIDGVNLAFATAFVFLQISVYLNGLRLREPDDYSVTGASTFSLVQAPLVGDTLSVDYVRS